jgi:hypothetical protein
MKENKPTKKAELPGDDLKCKAQGELCFDNDEKNSISVLERALEGTCRSCYFVPRAREREKCCC